MRLTIIATVDLLLMASPAAARADSAPTWEQGRDPQDTYELNTLGITHNELTTGWMFKSTSTWWAARRGKRRIAISESEFFRCVGREDLASRTEVRGITSQALFWGGFAAMAIGGFLTISGLHANDGQLGTKGWLGAGTVAAGLVSILAADAFGSQVVDEETARGMADDYNAALRMRLGAQVATTAIGWALRGNY